MAETAEGKVTQMLRSAAAGDSAAAEELLPLVYDELRRLAHHRMAHEAPGHTLQATALVHEAYVRLVGEAALPWQNRAHFFGAAARAMRQILVDSARRRRAAKRGGDRRRVGLDQLEIIADQPVLADPDQLLALDEAVDRLSQRDARKAQIVMLRFFAGLTIEQTANVMSLSLTTVKDEWQFARAWLFNELTRHDGAET